MWRLLNQWRTSFSFWSSLFYMHKCLYIHLVLHPLKHSPFSRSARHCKSSSCNCYTVRSCQRCEVTTSLVNREDWKTALNLWWMILPAQATFLAPCHLVYISCYIIFHHIIISYFFISFLIYGKRIVKWWDVLFLSTNSNRSFRCSYLLRPYVFMDSDPAVPHRCLPQRPRIGGWKWNAKGWWRGELNEWLRENVFWLRWYSWIWNLKEHTWLQIDCMTFETSNVCDMFVSLFRYIFLQIYKPVIFHKNQFKICFAKEVTRISRVFTAN